MEEDLDQMFVRKSQADKEVEKEAARVVDNFLSEEEADWPTNRQSRQRSSSKASGTSESNSDYSPSQEPQQRSAASHNQRERIALKPREQTPMRLSRSPSHDGKESVEMVRHADRAEWEKELRQKGADL